MKFSHLFFVLGFFGVTQATPCPSKAPVDDGDVSWMLTASALVLLMTPGLAFFYGGLVRSKNIINTMMMSFVAV